MSPKSTASTATIGGRNLAQVLLPSSKATRTSGDMGTIQNVRIAAYTCLLCLSELFFVCGGEGGGKGENKLYRGGQIYNQCRCRHLVAKFATNASGATGWRYFEIWTQ